MAIRFCSHLTGSCALVVVAMLALGTPADAQTTSTISGTVYDTSGGVLPGVTVTARQTATGYTRVVPTGADGRFVLPQLPVGNWEIRAELSGFKPVLRTGIVTTVGATVVVDFKLAVGGLTEEITVAGGASAVNVSSPELSYLVTGRELELPLNGRNFTDLALLQPGVIPFPHRDGGSVVAHGLGMSINGQDPRSNTYLLDGTLLNDFTNGPAGSAAGTTLGLETVQEFRVETNAYGAEFGRNSGGQINVVTKSGTNALSGSAYEFHRNEAFDARNFFDGPQKPDFWRHQFGVTLGGPLRVDRTFYFVGYEGLREKLGRTISTFVPDDNARRGLLPDPARPGQFIDVGVHPAVRPYIEAYPVANGPSAGQGIAGYTFNFDQRLDQDYVQGRVDYNAGPSHQLFARYTLDDAAQQLPTDYPQFPRSFVSRNQFFTGESQQIWSSRTLNTFRLGFSRTRIGQDVEANVGPDVAPFVPGRRFVGSIDVGGLQRFGTQSSVDVQLVQNVFSLAQNLAHTRGRHLFKAGGLVERYQMNMRNPTFSLGIFAFANLRSFLENRPLRFIGLTPEAQFDRYWRSTLVGLYAQDEFQLNHAVTLSAGLRYETYTMPEDIYGRDSTLVTMADREPTVGRMFSSPPRGNLSPRGGFAWNMRDDGRMSLRGGYGLYFNTNSQQNWIVTVTNPPATPRPVIASPSFPNPFPRPGSISIRPMQWDVQTPRVHVWNLSWQRELGFDSVVTVGYAGSRGQDLLRSSDVNVAQPTTLADGTVFIPAGTPRPNPAWTTIELKSSDGDSWYRALILDLRRRFSGGVSFQSSYTWSRSEDTTQASTFFSDATNGTTSAFPEFIPGYNRGPSDFNATHNLVVNFTWQIPFGRDLGGAAGAVLGGWQLSGIGQMRSGQPLTVFLASNRSRSLWAPSLGPGIGPDRPSYAPGRGPGDAIIGRPDQWFDPTAFAVQPAGTFGNTGRGDFEGPNLRTFDLSLVKSTPWGRLGSAGRVDFRIEMFNVFNRANFAPPNLTVFSGTADVEQPLPTFGRIRSTVTSARQVQLGVRVGW
jgi:hypothetical protein